MNPINTIVGVRDATPDDMRCVIGNWLPAFRTAHAAGVIAMDRYDDVMRPEIERIVQRSNVRVRVAYHPTASNPMRDIYGWMAHERIGEHIPVVHFVYVKEPYRRQGIARCLFNDAGIGRGAKFFYTFKTGSVSKLKSKIPNARWNPLIARFPEQEVAA